jgi:hypothetical protein
VRIRARLGGVQERNRLTLVRRPFRFNFHLQR